jgi:hypothetical protein
LRNLDIHYIILVIFGGKKDKRQKEKDKS